MTLRWRILSIITFTLFGLIIVLYAAAQTILLNSFAELEEQTIQRDVQRVHSALNDEMEKLDIFTLDWASWDDTYTFVADRNQAYIDSNLTDQLFMDAQLNLIVFVNPSGEIVFGKAYDTENEAVVPVPEAFQDHLTSDGLLNHPQLTSHVKGILTLPTGYLLVASRPITTSLKEGPVRGAIIMGRYLDAAFIDRLAQTTHLAFLTWPFADEQLPADVEFAKAGLSDQTPILVQALDADQVGGYTVVHDLYQRPALLLRVEEARVIYQQGQASLSYLLASLIIIGVCFTLLVVILLERTIVSRLLSLGEAVNHARSRINDPAISIPLRGHDELTQLARNIQGLLATIKQYQDQLHQTNAELETRVQVRTRELGEAVKRLEQEVAEREEAQREVAQARDEALEALKIKMQILANISHDVRSPLTIINLAVAMLQRTSEFDTRGMRHLDNIMVSTNQLLGFFNNLLEEARGSSANVQLNETAFAPIDLLLNVMNPLRLLADKKGLEINAEISPELPAILYGDQGRIEQILSNLVNNAIKFTAKGSIHINFCVSDAQHWGIKVTDTGQGIGPEDQASIFEAFWQVDASMTRQANRGVGLGLSIVKRLTELLGGTIEVQSEVGSGTTFFINLPLKQPEAQSSDEQATRIVD